MINSTPSGVCHKTRAAMYAASFDSITVGHVDIIHRAALLVDSLVVVVSQNPQKLKQYAFSLLERTEMVSAVCKELRIPDTQIVVAANDGRLTARFAESYGTTTVGAPITCFFRGIRDSIDFSKEMNEFYVTQQLCPNIEFLPLFCKPELGMVSSSMVKGLVGFEGWQTDVKRFLPSAIHQTFINKFTKGPQ